MQPDEPLIAADLANPLLERKGQATIAKTPPSPLPQPQSLATAQTPPKQIHPSPKSLTPTKPALSRRELLAQAHARDKAIAAKKAELKAQQAAARAAKRQAAIDAALANPTLHPKLLQQKKSIADQAADDNKTFARAVPATLLVELRQALQTVISPNGDEAAIARYQQAALAVSQTCDADAFTLLKPYVEQQHPDALLRQAYHLLATSPTPYPADIQQAVFNLLQQAASHDDHRAAYLLSRLYFSGEWGEQDSSQAAFWLAQAADAGNKKAYELKQELHIAKQLAQAQRDQDRYLQQLALGLVALVLVLAAVIVALRI